MKKRSSPAKRTQTAIFTAVVLFALTFFLHFIVSTIVPVSSDTITDWRFFSGETMREITGNIQTYQQATAQNPVHKTFGKNYVRLQYTLPAAQDERRLKIVTDYSPLKIELDGDEIANNGFGVQEFTGSAYQSVKIPGNGNKRVLEVYLYAPLAFRVTAQLHTEDATINELFGQYIGFGLSLALLLAGIVLFLLSILLSTGSKSIVRMLMLSLTVIVGGLLGILYALSRTTTLLGASAWFSVILLGQLLLMVMTFITVLFCYDKAMKNVPVFVPALIICVIVPIFGTAWSIQLAAGAIAVAQGYLAVRTLKVFSGASGSDVPQLGIMQGLVLYAALTGLANAFCLILGLSLFSSFLFGYSLSLLCLVLYVVYCRQVIYLDIKKYERIAQIYKDSAWIEGLTNLISRMFLQKNETTFLCEVAKSLSAIIEKNAEWEEQIDVHSCVGIGRGDSFQEIYNEGNLVNCDYAALAHHLQGEEVPLLIGNTTVDMLFVTERQCAVVHFENILSGLYGNIGNIIKAAFGNLRIAYQNLNLKNDMSSMQVELIIHLAQVVEQRSKATSQHQVAVSAMVYELCRELGIKEERSHLISMAAMAHDIGKIAISESILEKNGQLTQEEYQIMKQHTVYGYNILSLQSGEFFDAAAKIALEHHENFDGTGYQGKQGRDIDPGARVVHIIDVFEALLSKRAYKEAWTMEDAVQYIADGRGKQFDPAVTDAFLSCVARLAALRNTIYEEAAIKA